MKPLSRIVVIAALGLAGTAMAAQSGMAGHTGPDLRCGISVKTEGKLFTIEGSVLSPVALSGQYRFAIDSQGSAGTASINQGGAFSARPHEVTALGMVTLNAAATPKITLEVVANGERFNCSQHFIRPI